MRNKYLLILLLSTYGAFVGFILKNSPEVALQSFVGFMVVGLISSKLKDKIKVKVPVEAFAIAILLPLFYYLEFSPITVFNTMYIICIQRISVKKLID